MRPAAEGVTPDGRLTQSLQKRHIPAKRGYKPYVFGRGKGTERECKCCAVGILTTSLRTTCVYILPGPIDSDERRHRAANAPLFLLLNPATQLRYYQATCSTETRTRPSFFCFIISAFDGLGLSTAAALPEDHETSHSTSDIQ